MTGKVPASLTDFCNQLDCSNARDINAKSANWSAPVLTEFPKQTSIAIDTERHRSARAGRTDPNRMRRWTSADMKN